MSCPIPKGGGDKLERDDQQDPLVPIAPVVPEEHDPIAMEMEVDPNTDLDLCPDGENSVHDDPKTVQEVFDECRNRI